MLVVNIIKKICVLSLILILFSSLGFAIDYQVAFTLNTNNVEMCPSGTTQIIGVVRNTGENDDVYYITSDSEWVTLAPDKLTVGAGEEENVYVYITPEYSAEAGNYKIGITVKSEKTTDFEEISLDLLNCHGVELVPENFTKTGCLGDDVTINIDIKNTGKNLETFLIETSKGELSETGLAVNSDETKTIKLTVPVTTEEETVKVKARSELKTSYASDEIEIKIVGDDCYFAELTAISETQTVCKNEEGNFVFVIKNTGKAEDTFVLNTDAGVLSNDKISLIPEEAKEFVLTESFEEVGEYPIKVSAVSRHLELSKEVMLNVEECYIVELTTDKTSVNICPDTETMVALTLKNAGKRKDIYELETTNGELSETGVDLDVEEEKTIELVVTEDKQITINVTSYFVQESISVETVERTEEECFGFSAEAEQQTIEGREYKGYLFTIIVENTGLEKERYMITYDGPEWVYVDPQNLELTSEESGEVFVYMSPTFGTEAGLHKTTVNIENDRGLSKSQDVELILENVTLEQPLENAGETEEELEEETTEDVPVVEEETEENITVTPTGKVTIKSPKKLVSAIVLGLIAIIAIVFGPSLVEKTRNLKGGKGAPVSGVAGIPEKKVEKLEKSGINTADKLASSSPKKIAKMLNVSERTAEKYINSAKRLVKKKPKEKTVKEDIDEILDTI